MDRMPAPRCFAQPFLKHLKDDSGHTLAAWRRCLALKISLANSAGRGVAAGLLLLVEDYPWLAPRPWERLPAEGQHV
jgi:hypothetical protein